MKTEQILEKAIILDTETTGLKQPQVLECAFISYGDLSNYESLLNNYCFLHIERFDITNTIDSGAFRIHGISKRDIQGLPLFDYETLPIKDSIDYLIGHNINYDHRAMGKKSPLKRICTLKLSRGLWPELESHKLTAIMQAFFPDTYEQMIKNSHGALVDTKLCSMLLTKAMQEFEFSSWEDIYQIAGQK